MIDEVSQPVACGHRVEDADGAGWSCDLQPGHNLMHSFEDRIWWSNTASVVDGAL